jgi:tetratricopeptide (TPR) repeat protein
VSQPFWSVPHPRNAFFTGRDEVVAEVRKGLTRRRTAVLAQAISGLGGIGKTQTAVEYAYRYREEYQAVLWLNAESPLALKTGCGELARRLNLPYPENDLDQAVLALEQWLATHPGWLLIFDNADDPDVLKPFLPDAGHGHILITSRAQDFQDLGIFSPVELEELSVNDATTFLLDRCHRKDADGDERQAAEELARKLDGLPLALEQAAAFIVERKATFRDYLKSYQCRGLKLLEIKLPTLGRCAKSVATTWSANFEAVEEDSPAAADVLRLSAFLAPDAIPFELLARGASKLGSSVSGALSKADADPVLVNDLLWSLGRFSLIRIDRDAKTYGIHRLVQEVLKAAMDDPTRRLWAERAVQAVSQAFPHVEYDNWRVCGRLLPHALIVASWIERDGMMFQEAGAILNNTAVYLRERGQYGDAKPLLLLAVKIRRTALGERHPDYVSSLTNLAKLYFVTGRHVKAEPLLLLAVKICRTALGERLPDYATALNNLAGLCDPTSRHWEAELSNQAGMYDAAERYRKAEPLLRQALEIRRTALGEGHPDYASSLNNVAAVCYATGRHDEAEALFLGALEIRRTALGEWHPDYATSLNNLAALYDATGRHSQAEPLYSQALVILCAALGRSHPRYQRTLSNYLRNQQEGSLPVPDGELLADDLGGPPAPPSETGEGDADSDASGA